MRRRSQATDGHSDSTHQRLGRIKRQRKNVESVAVADTAKSSVVCDSVNNGNNNNSGDGSKGVRAKHNFSQLTLDPMALVVGYLDLKSISAWIGTCRATRYLINTQSFADKFTGSMLGFSYWSWLIDPARALECPTCYRVCKSFLPGKVSKGLCCREGLSFFVGTETAPYLDQHRASRKRLLTRLSDLYQSYVACRWTTFHQRLRWAKYSLTMIVNTLVELGGPMRLKLCPSMLELFWERYIIQSWVGRQQLVLGAINESHFTRDTAVVQLCTDESYLALCAVLPRFTQFTKIQMVLNLAADPQDNDQQDTFYIRRAALAPFMACVQKMSWLTEIRLVLNPAHTILQSDAGGMFCSDQEARIIQGLLSTHTNLTRLHLGMMSEKSMISLFHLVASQTTSAKLLELCWEVTIETVNQPPSDELVDAFLTMLFQFSLWQSQNDIHFPARTTDIQARRLAAVLHTFRARYSHFPLDAVYERFIKSETTATPETLAIFQRICAP